MADWSERSPPMRPAFDSRTRRRMWVEVEFVVDSTPGSEGFSRAGFPGFPPSTTLKSNSIGIQGLQAFQSQDCSVQSSLNKVVFYIYLYRDDDDL